MSNTWAGMGTPLMIKAGKADTHSLMGHIANAGDRGQVQCDRLMAFLRSRVFPMAVPEPRREHSSGDKAAERPCVSKKVAPGIKMGDAGSEGGVADANRHFENRNAFPRRFYEHLQFVLISSGSYIEVEDLGQGIESKAALGIG